MIKNWFTTSEMQNLIGPTVVGCILGAFSAYTVFAFASEYQLQSVGAPSTLQTASEAGIVFIVCVVGTVAILGLLPVLVARRQSRPNSDA